MRLNNRYLQIQHTNVQLSHHIATNLHPAVRTCISAPRCPKLLPHCCAFAAFAAQDLFVRHTTSGLQCARRVVAQLSAPTPECASTIDICKFNTPTSNSVVISPPTCTQPSVHASPRLAAPSCCPIVALSQHLQHRTCLLVARPAACSAQVVPLRNSALPRLNAPQQSTSANSTHQRPTQSSYRHQPAPSLPYMHLRASLPQVAAPLLRLRSICSAGLVCPSHDQRPAVRRLCHCPTQRSHA